MTIRALVADLARIRREARRHVARPPYSGLVVEVGGGQAPHPRADVVVEKYVADDFERERGARLSFAKPLVVGDGHALPLASGSAAYAIAAHVLEHATDPVTFAAELARVARAGFVQVPSREAELAYGWPFHPWLIDRDGDKLLFRARGGLEAPIGEVVHRLHAESPLFALAFQANRSIWHHSVEWVGDLEVEVSGSALAAATATFDLEATAAALEAADVVPLPRAVVAALACPACRGPVVLRTDEAVCRMCAASYVVIGGVPILVTAPGEALRPATAERTAAPSVPGALRVA